MLTEVQLETKLVEVSTKLKIVCQSYIKLRQKLKRKDQQIFDLRYQLRRGGGNAQIEENSVGEEREGRKREVLESTFRPVQKISGKGDGQWDQKRGLRNCKSLTPLQFGINQSASMVPMRKKNEPRMSANNINNTEQINPRTREHPYRYQINDSNSYRTENIGGESHEMISAKNSKSVSPLKFNGCGESYAEIQGGNMMEQMMDENYEEQRNIGNGDFRRESNMQRPNEQRMRPNEQRLNDNHQDYRNIRNRDSATEGDGKQTIEPKMHVSYKEYRNIRKDDSAAESEKEKKYRMNTNHKQQRYIRNGDFRMENERQKPNEQKMNVSYKEYRNIRKDDFTTQNEMKRPNEQQMSSYQKQQRNIRNGSDFATESGIQRTMKQRINPNEKEQRNIRNGDSATEVDIQQQQIEQRIKANYKEYRNIRNGDSETEFDAKQPNEQRMNVSYKQYRNLRKDDFPPENEIKHRMNANYKQQRNIRNNADFTTEPEIKKTNQQRMNVNNYNEQINIRSDDSVTETDQKNPLQQLMSVNHKQQYNIRNSHNTKITETNSHRTLHQLHHPKSIFSHISPPNELEQSERSARDGGQYPPHKIGKNSRKNEAEALILRQLWQERDKQIQRMDDLFESLERRIHSNS